MDRKRKRIFRRERRSEKWAKLNKIFKKEVKSAKANFYKEAVADLKLKKPSQWYSCLKKITSFDQLRNDQTNVEEISQLTDQQQAEKIAHQFASIQNEYEPLKTEDISVPPFVESDIPQFHPAQVWFVLSRINTNKATVPGDFPAKLIKQFAAYLAEPLSDIFNTSIRRGEYPRIYKFEISTPVPKVFPTELTSQLRNISGLLNFDRIFEKLISKGNIVTYKMLDRIMSVFNNNSKEDMFDVVAKLI